MKIFKIIMKINALVTKLYHSGKNNYKENLKIK